MVNFGNLIHPKLFAMSDYYFKQNDCVSINKVIYLEAMENYTRFHLKDGTSLISSSTLKVHEAILSKYTFLRINRSMLVNAEYVKKVVNKNRTNFVRMKNGLEIRVSRRRQESLENLPV